MKSFYNISRLSLIVILITAFQISPFKSFAQKDSVSENIPFQVYWYLQPSIGVSQYFGDLNKKDYWNQNPKFAFGAAMGYQIRPVFGLRGQFVKAKLYSERTDHNFKLTSDLWDGAMHLTININEIFAVYNAKRLFNFYLFTGVGMSSFKSKLINLPTGVIINQHK